MITVTKVFRFEACHHLPHYDGKCHNLHGHSYKLEVTVTGNITSDPHSPKQGMIVDFKDLKHMVNNFILNKYDHSNLNDFFPNPTAEIMVESIGSQIMILLHDFYIESGNKLDLVSVKLWETEDSYAEFKSQRV